ncbi:hypothetical protein ACWV27_26290 (plasmid) [Massilia varians]
MSADGDRFTVNLVFGYCVFVACNRALGMVKDGPVLHQVIMQVRQLRFEIHSFSPMTE